jgi:energy-converting hydrogenase Eha subunit F
MSTYNKFHDEESVNNNAVLAVFAIVLAALIVIGFLMSQSAYNPPIDSQLNQNSTHRMESRP